MEDKLKEIMKICSDEKGQNAIEYLLLIAIVLIVLIAALAPGGFLTRAVDESLDTSIETIELMAANVWD